MPDSQTLGLVIAASVAGLVAVRLYWVLGRRTGLEPQALAQPAPQPAPIVMVTASGNGVLDIQHADPDFDTVKFLEGVRAAYGHIIAAFVSGDVEALKPLVSPDVLSAFETAIQARVGAVPALTKLNDARIVGARLDGRTAEVTVAFTADFEGRAVSDVWSFSRVIDADASWILVATSGELPE